MLLKSWIKSAALGSLERIEYGTFDIHLPDGSRHQYQGAQPGSNATLYVHDWQVLSNMALHGDIGFAEDYRAGLCDTPDLTALVQFTLENESALNSYLHGGRLFRLLAHMANWLHINTLNGSKRNIQAHYDLGNAFYELWLDPSMTYSSALFSAPGESLQQAQINKYDRILNQLNARSGNVLEIGCGWGGFAERALQRGDFAIKGITLSEEQKKYADHRLKGHADIALEDYRSQTGLYDHIVSIEMFEAVGERYWPAYFGQVKNLLARGGRAMVQTITIQDARFEAYRRASDIIRTYIFPGGMLPSPSRFSREAEQAGLRVTDRHAFGKDYAETMRHWLETFENRRREILALGFDDSFIRLWRLYLASCIACFSVGKIDVMQVELQHAA
jgi:cyclopropane-fatty-acyl-phospholipid synthase